ncbi:hypothetical protein C8Q76DRAFT_756538 [Earliella scabrosa]|nr:hypothetical protein C8Q76DRAFT_756538 [Earliella scabrosa]
MDSDTALFQAKALHRIIAANIKLSDQKRVQSATTALAENLRCLLIDSTVAEHALLLVDAVSDSVRLVEEANARNLSGCQFIITHSTFLRKQARNIQLALDDTERLQAWAGDGDIKLHTMSAAFTATICEDIYDVHGDNSALIAAHGTELKDLVMLRPSYASQLLTQLRRRTDMYMDSHSAQEKLAMEIADLRTAEAARRQGLEGELAAERSAKALLQDQVCRTYVLRP